LKETSAMFEGAEIRTMTQEESDKFDEEHFQQSHKREPERQRTDPERVHDMKLNTTQHKPKYDEPNKDLVLESLMIAATIVVICFAFHLWITPQTQDSLANHTENTTQQTGVFELFKIEYNETRLSRTTACICSWRSHPNAKNNRFTPFQYTCTLEHTTRIRSMASDETVMLWPVHRAADVATYIGHCFNVLLYGYGVPDDFSFVVGPLYHFPTVEEILAIYTKSPHTRKFDKVDPFSN
jgi:hypothetical protein